MRMSQNASLFLNRWVGDHMAVTSVTCAAAAGMPAGHLEVTSVTRVTRCPSGRGCRAGCGCRGTLTGDHLIVTCVTRASCGTGRGWLPAIERVVLRVTSFVDGGEGAGGATQANGGAAGWSPDRHNRHTAALRQWTTCLPESQSVTCSSQASHCMARTSCNRRLVGYESLPN